MKSSRRVAGRDSFCLASRISTSLNLGCLMVSKRIMVEIEKLNKDILKMFSVEAVSTVRCTDVDYVSETKITNL